MTMNQEHFRTLTDHHPFPWQCELYDRIVADPPGSIPAVASIPTGLGKTSVIAVWLLAWLAKPECLPRRLVYVVNRRTVVDQTTVEVIRIRQNLRKLDGHNLTEEDLAISTLRGQHADDGAWRADPSRPAAICGTVDMIGSRLLFSGYHSFLALTGEASLKPASSMPLGHIRTACRAARPNRAPIRESALIHVIARSAAPAAGGGLTRAGAPR